MLMLRVWYLFRASVPARLFAVFISASCQIAAFAILGVIYNDLNAISFDLPGFELEGCLVPAPTNLWRLWVPPLILHTLLYVFTAVQAVLRRNMYGKRNVVLDRLLRDGGILYLAVLGIYSPDISSLSSNVDREIVTIGFCAIGSTTKNPSVSISAVYSNVMIGLVSVCMSRVMFSIHSLAENLNCDPDWLLNHVELSRVNWKKGSTDGELVVEMDVVEATEDPEYGHRFAVRTTRVGTTPEPDYEPPFLVMA
ncbi:hypothetical protein GLOTRDRAFT_123816 [Gloeophyllum trabeum ATCC 11539]|uniref:Uncharacterized protein n=1 Tax=Gloeophyllum trabeum (strain ATCC 11539 / FP-39264 / Madison 617) TaxID=670483 RepID=S7QL87_GLOTA|nr:uncharacterized protein GLOTRDRAFT_123816 [Gloeophyllum trabeum ATCC 11539]EPQ60057.1 hypothetical protein GLOTRDRAFT_123816 [Gloeophyllum trabeum ATCC 11539]